MYYCALPVSMCTSCGQMNGWWSSRELSAGLARSVLHLLGSQVAERLGNRDSNQKVVGSCPGHAKWRCVLGQGTSPYFPRGECPCTYCKSLWISVLALTICMKPSSHRKLVFSLSTQIQSTKSLKQVSFVTKRFPRSLLDRNTSCNFLDFCSVLEDVFQMATEAHVKDL